MKKKKGSFIQSHNNLFLELANKCIDIFNVCNLITFNVKTLDYRHKISVIDIPKNISELILKDKRYVLPLKLPMITAPNDYSEDTKGGYLLNDVDVDQELIIGKIGYKVNSTIDCKNTKIYSVVNSMARCPYKINTDVLNFLQTNGKMFNILIDDNKITKDCIENSSDYKKKELRKLKSQKHLKLTILELAFIYKDMNSIYFPLRLDNRGRVYCESHYLNYQGSDLAKSLLSFAIPGFILRDDNNAIECLKLYGANCFGNNLDKKSYNATVN